MNDSFAVSIVEPVIHYCMGGLLLNPEGEVLDPTSKPVPNLYCAGEVCGGVHGKNRLGGNSLLDCVVFGRVSARTATRNLLRSLMFSYESLQKEGKINTGSKRMQTIAGQVTTSAPLKSTSGSPGGNLKSYSLDEVAKHNQEKDCWVVLFDKVYDVTKFLKDHPGGIDAIMLFAGQDATEQFDMLHQPSVLKKFGPDYQIGIVKK